MLGSSCSVRSTTGTAPPSPEASSNSWIAEGVIEYLGETDDVRPFVAAASAVVLPSYREGLPRTLLEAAAMARPLIATDVPGCREVVENGINGFLCQVRDSESLAKAMKMLSEMPASKRSGNGRGGAPQGSGAV